MNKTCCIFLSYSVNYCQKAYKASHLVFQLLQELYTFVHFIMDFGQKFGFKLQTLKMVIVEN